MFPFSRSDDTQTDSNPASNAPANAPANERQSSLTMAREQTEAILRGIKKRRGEEIKKAGAVGAGVAAAAAACGVKLKRRLRKNTREKQRRLELNDKFDALNDLLPTGGQSKTEKYNILSEAIKLIGDLQQENQDLRQEKVGLVNELNKLSIYMQEVSNELEQPTPSVSSQVVSTSFVSTPSVAAPEVSPALGFVDNKMPTASDSKVAPQFPPTSALSQPAIFSLQASLDALVGFDIPMPFPPLPPTPSSTPPPDLFSLITGSYGPIGGMTLTNSIAGPCSNTLFHPSPHANVANIAGMPTEDIDIWMS